MKTFIITKTVKAKNITQAIAKEGEADIDEIKEDKTTTKQWGFQRKDEDESDHE